MSLPLLFGCLTVTIVKAQGLKNADGGRIASMLKRKKDLSDPYVKVALDSVKICRTKTLTDDLNPVFEEVFELQVNGRYVTLNFRVFDADDFAPDTLLGYAEISVGYLLQSGGKFKGTLELGPLPGHSSKGNYGGLTVKVEYTSNDELFHSYEVPNVSFPCRENCRVSLFQDAHIGSSAALLPPVRVQPSVRSMEVPDYKSNDYDNQGEKEAKRRKRKLKHIQKIRHQLYKLDHKSSSESEEDDERRPHGIEHIIGIDDEAPTKEWTYKRKNCWESIYKAILRAKHFIYITGWSVDTNISLLRERPIYKNGKGPTDNDNGMLTIGELLIMKYREGVQVCLLLWNEATSLAGSQKEGMMCTHDEKTKAFFNNTDVQVTLAYREGAAGNKLLWTHHQKSVILDAPALHSVDQEVDMNLEARRVIAFIGGLDLCDGRWDTPEHSLYRTLETHHKTDFHMVWPGVTADFGPREPWHDIHSKVEGPIARDIMRNFEQRWRKQASQAKVTALVNLDNLPFISIDEEAVCDPQFWDSWSVQLFRSIDASSAIMETADSIDNSIQTAYVHHIRRAKRFIFIENQYFIGSSQAWLNGEGKNIDCHNIIPLELTLRICSAIRAKERFAVYILLPMYPEGVPTDAAVQEILAWQCKTIQMMYDRIHMELKQANMIPGAKPEDYLNFFCMGQREIVEANVVVKEFDTATRPYQVSLNVSRRFAIYVHSKMMIVDDDYIIVGSANINERSMAGNRDSEIAVGAFQPHFTSETCSSKPRGDIHAFRLALFSSHMRRMLPCFLEPESLECVRKINEITLENWNLFSGDTPVEMEPHGHLLKYPLSVSDTGIVCALPGKEFIPDTNAPIMGCTSAMIPDILTT